MIGQGLVYPTRDRILHGRTMTPCFVKVQLDTVEKKFWEIPVPSELETDELVVFRDAVSQFVQWPRKSIRLQDTMSPHNSMTGPIDISPLHLQTPTPPRFDQLDSGQSSCYRPHMEMTQMFEETMEDQQPTPFEHQTNPFMELLQESMAPNRDQMINKKNSTSPNPLTVTKRIKERLDKLELRPSGIRTLAKQFEPLHTRSVEAFSPNGMYPEPLTEVIEYETLLDWCIKGWIDYTLIHWCEMHCFMLSDSTRRNKCAFFSIYSTLDSRCIEDPVIVEGYIREIYRFHKDKSIFVAQYLQEGHYSLIIVCPKIKRGYILDSLKGVKNEDCYHLTDIMEQVFGKLKWSMVNCRQQENSWESGHLVMMNMFELVMIYQQNFPQKIWHDSSIAQEEDLDKFLHSLAPQFITTMIKGRNLSI